MEGETQHQIVNSGRSDYFWRITLTLRTENQRHSKCESLLVIAFFALGRGEALR
jgi:hypothetical protein